MPFVSAKNQRILSVAVQLLAGLLLLIGTVPILNITAVQPIFGNISIGTLLGIALLYYAYVAWTRRGM